MLPAVIVVIQIFVQCCFLFVHDYVQSAVICVSRPDPPSTTKSKTKSEGHHVCSFRRKHAVVYHIAQWVRLKGKFSKETADNSESVCVVCTGLAQ
jgi:hypothetical protein